MTRLSRLSSTRACSGSQLLRRAAGDSARKQLRLVAAGDVAFEGADGFLLAADDPLDEIANRDEADDLVVLDHREMAEAVLGHEGEAFVDGVAKGDGKDRAGHDVSHARFLRGVAKQGAFARVIALGEDAEQMVVGADEQSADVVLGHEFERFEDRVVGGDGQDAVLPFAFQHKPDGAVDAHATSSMCGPVQRDGPPAPGIMELECSAKRRELSPGKEEFFGRSWLLRRNWAVLRRKPSI